MSEGALRWLPPTGGQAGAPVAEAVVVIGTFSERQKLCRSRYGHTCMQRPIR